MTRLRLLLARLWCAQVGHAWTANWRAFATLGGLPCRRCFGIYRSVNGRRWIEVGRMERVAEAPGAGR